MSHDDDALAEREESQWKGYFESLSRADQRRFAGIFGPRLVRNDEELRVLNEALSDDGRIARLTKP